MRLNLIALHAPRAHGPRRGPGGDRVVQRPRPAPARPPPLPELKALYEERWAAWEAEPPEWFVLTFQECVYDELVPAHVLEARIQAPPGP